MAWRPGQQRPNSQSHEHDRSLEEQRGQHDAHHLPLQQQQYQQQYHHQHQHHQHAAADGGAPYRGHSSASAAAAAAAASAATATAWDDWSSVCAPSRQAGHVHQRPSSANAPGGSQEAYLQQSYHNQLGQPDAARYGASARPVSAGHHPPTYPHGFGASQLQAPAPDFASGAYPPTGYDVDILEMIALDDEDVPAASAASMFSYPHVHSTQMPLPGSSMTPLRHVPPVPRAFGGPETLRSSLTQGELRHERQRALDEADAERDDAFPSPVWEPVPSKYRQSGDNSSLDVFMSFCTFYRHRLTGAVRVDASRILSKECFERWLKTRQRSLKKPEESFRKTITAHCTGTDGRKPFLREVEAAVLEVLRRQIVWPCFEGRKTAKGDPINIGQQGFRGNGFHEDLALPPEQRKIKRGAIMSQTQNVRNARPQQQQQPQQPRAPRSLPPRAPPQPSSSLPLGRQQTGDSPGSTVSGIPSSPIATAASSPSSKALQGLAATRVPPSKSAQGALVSAQGQNPTLKHEPARGGLQGSDSVTASPRGAAAGQGAPAARSAGRAPAVLAYSHASSLTPQFGTPSPSSEASYDTTGLRESKRKRALPESESLPSPDATGKQTNNTLSGASSSDGSAGAAKSSTSREDSIREVIRANLSEWSRNPNLILVACERMGMSLGEFFGGQADKDAEFTVDNALLILQRNTAPVTLRAAGLTVMTKYFRPHHFLSLMSIANVTHTDGIFEKKVTRLPVNLADPRFSTSFLLPTEGLDDSLPTGCNIFCLNTFMYISSDPVARSILEGTVSGNPAFQFLHPLQFWMVVVHVIPQLMERGELVWQSFGKTFLGRPMISRSKYVVVGDTVQTRFQNVSHLYPELMAMPSLEEVVERENASLHFPGLPLK